MVSLHRLIPTAVFLAAVIVVQPASAQETKLLRWKFREGERLRLVCSQTIDTTRTVKGRMAQMSMVLTIEMDWQVKSVDKTGNAQINQSFRRLTAKLNAANGQSISFDSSAKIKPTGLAQDVADKLLPLIGKNFTVAMTTRGTINKVTLSDELQEAIADASGANEARAELFTAKGISDLMKQFAVTLPEKAVATGAKWKTQQGVALPFGKLTLDNNFVYQGPAVVRGRPVLKIGVSSQVKIAAPNKRTKLKKYEHTGAIQFDEVLGRLATATSKQAITATTRLRDVIIEVKLATTITSTLTKSEKASSQK